MQPTKNLPVPESNASESKSAEPNPIDNESITTDADPRPGRPSTALSVRPSRMRRSSHSSLRSEPCTSPPVSCVSRGSVTGEDCARQRFIVWAAVKRNRSTRMATSERLRCPLLRCGESFDRHEEMLRHLMQCQHLSTGEYLCYECMKVERFNDKKCTCCLGQPTKRRRIINMAKHFFSSIGNAKARRENHGTFTHNIQSCGARCGSPTADMHEEFGRAQMESSAQWEERYGEGEQMTPGQLRLELNGTELAELDSRPLPPTAELEAVDHDIHHITPGPLTRCTTTRKTLLPLVPSPIPKARRAQGFPTTAQLNTGMSGSGGRRPSLALNTQVDHYRTKPDTTYLSPDLSLQSSPHGISPVTPWSTSSKSSTIWSTASSGDPAVTSPITPLSASVHLTAPQQDSLFVAERDIDMFTCPDSPRCYTPGEAPKFSRDNPLPSEIPRLIPDPPMFPYDPNDSYSWISSMNSEVSLGTSINMMFTDPNTKAIPPEFLGPQITGSEARVLVEQVWDALGEHFSNSVSKLSSLQHNPLAASLRIQTPIEVASAGLARFRKILNHNYTARQDPVEYLCFVHLMYSVSLVLYPDSFTTRSNQLYEQAVAYNALFDPAYRDNYYQVVSTIWQQNTQDSTSRGRFGDSSSGTTGNKGKEPDYHTGSITIVKADTLLVMGQNFLDELESIIVNSNGQQSVEVIRSEIWSSHFASNQQGLQGPTPLTLASSYLVQDLCRRYHDAEDLLQKLKVIAQSARAGYYPTVRKLELELIQTGKSYFVSNDQDRYILQVRALCDEIYSQSGTRPRAEYHLLGISLVEGLIRSVAREPQHPQDGHPAYPLIPYPYGDEFLSDLNKTFWAGYPIIPTTQQPVSPGRVTDYGPPLGLATLHPVNPETQPSTSSPDTLLLGRDISETPSEPYTVSPAPDAPLEPPAPSPYRLTPPSHTRGDGGSASGTSTLPSSGQKVEANERCEICGYRPKGDPQWFKGSMAKHKKLQHSTNPPIIYKCPFPGCNSEYKNRRDNLRQHQIEKNHFVGDGATQRTQKRKRR